MTIQKGWTSTDTEGTRFLRRVGHLFHRFFPSNYSARCLFAAKTYPKLAKTSPKTCSNIKKHPKTHQKHSKSSMLFPWRPPKKPRDLSASKPRLSGVGREVSPKTSREVSMARLKGLEMTTYEKKLSKPNKVNNKLQQKGGNLKSLYCTKKNIWVEISQVKPSKKRSCKGWIFGKISGGLDLAQLFIGSPFQKIIGVLIKT